LFDLIRLSPDIPSLIRQVSKRSSIFVAVQQNRPGQYRFRTGDQALVRQINLSVIMHHLRENAPISRAALAEITGLNKTTVSSLVRELIERQFVREVGFESSGSKRSAGRLAVLLTLDPNAGFIVSAEIGVDFISVVCTNFAPEIIWRHKETISPDMGQQVILDRVLALLHKAAVVGQAACANMLGISIGVPGLVDQASGTLLFAPNLGWQDIPLGKTLSDEFTALVLVDNEANFAALGEHYFGAAQGYEEVLYISAGVGLGGGMVHNGRIYSGVAGFGGEFGHITMDPKGSLCNCGNRGCWETQVSQRALFRHIRKSINKGTVSMLTGLTKGDSSQLTVPLVVEAAEAGDPLALEALDQVGHYLGIGIASLVNALNPELVVFGGILSLAGKFLLPVVEREMKHRGLRWNRSATQVVLARHGFDACVMGGVARVYQAILAEPDLIRRQATWATPPQSNYANSGTSRKEVRSPADISR
jgi:glucokinase-like ROK family protein